MLRLASANRFSLYQQQSLLQAVVRFWGGTLVKEPRGGDWRVLYVDGEMHITDIQERARLLLDAVPGINRSKVGSNLGFLARQQQEPDAGFPSITDEFGTKFILKAVREAPFDLIVLDNFSTLGQVEDENAASSFNSIQTFLLALKVDGVATMLVHHAGKERKDGGGDFRGSSKLAATRRSGGRVYVSARVAPIDLVPNAGENAMQHSRLCLSFIVTVAMIGAVEPNFGLAQTEAPSQTPVPATPGPQPPSAALGPYKPVPITLPKTASDPSFDAFRKELAEIAQRRDRAALAERVAANFFWIPETTDLADKQRPAIENVAKALSLDGPDGVGWDTISAYAGEASAVADPQHNGLVCSPAEASFDEVAADELADATQTDATDWVFPIRDGVEVRSGDRQDAAVIETLGLYLVRVIPDDSPANAVLSVIKVLTPSGKVGFVPLDSVLPIGGEQMCYVKEPSGWKIAGFLGGEANQ